MATLTVVPLKHGEYFAEVDNQLLPVVALRVIDHGEDGVRYHPVFLDDGWFIDLAPHRVEVVTRAKVDADRLKAEWDARYGRPANDDFKAELRARPHADDGDR